MSRNDPFAIARNQLTDSEEMEQTKYRGPCSSQAVHHDLHIPFFLSDDLERVDDSCEGHNSRPVLIIMEYRDIKLLLQALFDLEAARSGDVLQIDSSEGRSHRLHDPYDLFGILSRKHDRDCVDSGEFLEEHTFALHDRESSLRSDISESEHCASIADYCDRVALHGIKVGQIFVFRYLKARGRNSRGVQKTEVLLRVYGHFR